MAYYDSFCIHIILQCIGNIGVLFALMLCATDFHCSPTVSAHCWHKQVHSQLQPQGMLQPKGWSAMYCHWAIQHSRQVPASQQPRTVQQLCRLPPWVHDCGEQEAVSINQVTLFCKRRPKYSACPFFSSTSGLLMCVATMLIQSLLEQEPNRHQCR